MTPDIQSDLMTEAEEPEGATVRVLTTNRMMAEAVAPMLAARLWPGHEYGRVLHIEPVDGGYDVTVRVGRSTYVTIT